jgi:hypothetical protein
LAARQVLVLEEEVQVLPPEFVRADCEHVFVPLRYSEGQARAAIAESRSYAEALRALGAVRKWVRQYEFELSAWAQAGCPGPSVDSI